MAILLLIRSDRKGLSNKVNGEKTIILNKDSSTLNNFNVDYDIYVMSKQERIVNICLAAIVIFVGAFVFYRSYIISAAIIPFAFLYPKIKVKEIIKRRKHNLNLQFRDLLYSLSASLMAGKSIESAFRTSFDDLSIQYPEQDTDIIREITYIVHRLEMNYTIEEAIIDFSNRARIEDIENFVNVFKVCKRSGGDLVQVIKSTTDIINEKIHIKQEIENLIAQRRFEQKVLSFLPFALVALINISAADFMAPVFTTIKGRIAMTIAVGLFVAAYFVSKKLMSIEV
jgi:tight adherence protein B